MRTTKTACRNLQPTEASAVIELQTRTKYGYDNIYELLSAAQGGTTTESYTYDPVGNRLSNVSGSGWSNNTSNELTSRPGVTYSYDANGNTTSKSDSTGATTYAWDYENRLVSVALPGSGGTVTFKYDPFGRRIYKSSSSATSVYTYDGDNLIEETNSTGSVVARYSQGLNIDEPLVGLRSGTTSYYEADGLGSVTTLSNAAGAVSNNYTYDSFGNLVASSGSIVNNFRYTGREWDPETSLYYYRARYYDQSTGRFLTEDPAGFDVNTDFFAYVGNSPLNWTDPLGLSQNDVNTIIHIYRNTVNRMNLNGERRPGQGHPNGWINDFLWHRWPWSPKRYKSCDEQANEVKGDLDGRKWDDGWMFDVVDVEGGFGRAVRATSSNPNDPILILDPWLNKVEKQWVAQ